MKITSKMLAAFLRCPTACYLCAIGRPRGSSRYAKWVRARQEAYQKRALGWLREQKPDAELVVAPSTENLKASTWTCALDLHVQTENTESDLHAVERLRSGRAGQRAEFIPIRFVAGNKLTRSDRLVLAFDALALSQGVGRDITRGKIIHGDQWTVRRVSVRPLLREIRNKIDEIQTLVASPAAPDLVPNRSCPRCEFHDYCRLQLVKKDDLSLLAGMTAPDRKEYQNKGIFTVNQLSYTFRPRRRPKHLRAKREPYHHALKALAVRDKKTYIVGKPELKIEGTPVYLDVEGLPDRDFYYLIGVRIGAGDSTIQHSLWADDPSQEPRIWSEFLNLISAAKNPVLIHYGSYESAFLKRFSDRYGGPPEETPAAKVIGSSLNLLSFIFAQIYFPTYSNGLKEIAGHLGFQWAQSNASGLDAIEWRERWEQSHHDRYKQKLLSYNAQDCEGLDVVTCAVLDLLNDTAHDAQSGGSDRQVVRTDELKEAHLSRWCKFASPIQELVEITNCAHWDYQRERVYFRSSTILKRLRKRRARVPNWHVDKSVQVSCNPICPFCGRKGIPKGPIRSRSVQVLIFGQHSLKRRTVRYDYKPYWCRRCMKLFGVDERLLRPGKRRKYGRSLIAYLFYQIIALYIPAQVVAQSAERLFGLVLNTGTLAYFKRDLAAVLCNGTGANSAAYRFWATRACGRNLRQHQR
ncbi:MAG: TM0106 family RecB-like putative nuclease [Verrucomicrobiia bacterium]